MSRNRLAKVLVTLAFLLTFGGLSLQEKRAGESVPLFTLDSMALPACHLLKIDVEGFEVPVLRGARRLLQGSGRG